MRYIYKGRVHYIIYTSLCQAENDIKTTQKVIKVIYCQILETPPRKCRKIP